MSRARRGALLVALVLGVVGCGPAVDRLELSLVSGPAGLQATHSGHDEGRIALLVGRLWTGEGQLVGMGPGVHVVVPAGTALRGRSVPAGRTRTETIPPAALGRHGLDAVIQAVAFGGDDTGDVVAVSPTLAVSDGRPVDGSRLPLVLLVLALLAGGGWFLSRALGGVFAGQAIGRAPGLVLVGLAFLGVAVLRLSASPQRVAVERGFDTPPVGWPADWDREADGRDLALGPGFDRLLAAAREQRREGEALHVVAPEEGLAMVRGLHLSHELGVELTTRTPAVAPTGLVVWVGGNPKGEVLLSTGAGVLARVEAGR